jgi:hypothetical protein
MDSMKVRKTEIGKKVWAIAEGYIPDRSCGVGRDFESHEAICLLNCNESPAIVELVLYFRNRDPVGPYLLEVEARRTLHQRLNDLQDPEPVPRETDYSMVIRSSVPIVVQHTRLDSRQAELALMTTIAYFQE